MNYRMLTSKDKDACFNLLSSNQSLKISPCPPVLSLSNYYLNDDTDLMIVFGEFSDDNDLKSCLFATFSYNTRSWSIDYIVKKENINVRSLIGLISYAIEYAEQRGYHTLYSVYFDNYHVKLEKFIYRYSDILSRYTAMTETIIPNNRKSSFTEYWGRFQKYIMYDRLMVVRQYSLNENYRMFI